MPERTIDPAQLASYTAHLRREERSPGHRLKKSIQYPGHGIQGLLGPFGPGAWEAGAKNPKVFPKGENWLPNGGITCSLKDYAPGDH